MKKLYVVKVGGAILEDPEKKRIFMDSFSGLNESKILVHGGGRSATHLAEKMGLESKMIVGRRVTDDAMLDIVTMMYGGKINKEIVGILQSHGINAIGLGGMDGNLIQSEIRSKKPVDYGWVGDPVRVNSELLNMLISNGYIPVLAPLTHDKQGHILNTNADTITRSIGEALSSQYNIEVLFCFELPGVLKDINNPDSLIKEITSETYQQMIDSREIHGGMIPKLENAFNMIKKGVSSVRIIHFGQLTHLVNNYSNAGTVIKK